MFQKTKMFYLSFFNNVKQHTSNRELTILNYYMILIYLFHVITIYWNLVYAILAKVIKLVASWVYHECTLRRLLSIKTSVDESVYHFTNIRGTFFNGKFVYITYTKK